MNNKPPYLSFQDIANTIVNLRTEYSSLTEIPIDIEGFVELDLGIDIIPQAGMRHRIKADALITSDFKSILIDNDYYNDSKRYGRNRFSIAHEIGHLFLHKDYFISQCPASTEEEWISFINDMDDTVFYWLERQADMFAGLLLMPLEEVIASIMAHESPETMSRKFEVSLPAIRHRINDTDIWEIIGKQFN